MIRMLDHKGNLTGKEAPPLTHLTSFKRKTHSKQNRMNACGGTPRHTGRKTAQISWSIY